MQMQNTKGTILIGLLMIGVLASWQPVWAAPEDLQRLFFTPMQREAVETARNAYLNKQTAKQDPTIQKKLMETAQVQHPPSNAAKKPKIKPKPVSVSAVVLLPNGDQLVRINQRFYKVDSQSNLSIQAQLSVAGQSILIPVGETYLPDKKQWIKNYQLTKELPAKKPTATLQTLDKENP